MSVETLRNALFWCSIINVGLLAFWGLLTISPHGWLHRIWSRWSRISAEQFDAINLGGIVLYKILIIVFNVVPYIALRIVG